MYKEVKLELQKIQEILETPLNDDVNSSVEKANILTSFQARAGYLMAEFKEKAREKKGDNIAALISTVFSDKHLSAKTQNALVDSYAREELFIFDWAERINSACTHQIEYIRTLISKAKAEMQYLNSGGT